MSLTSLLNSPSPLRKFFADKFPNTRELVSSLNSVLAENAPSISAALSQPNLAVIGSAFDYRARLYFGPLNLDRVTARHGVVVLQGILPKKARTRPDDVFSHIGQLLRQHAIPGELLPESEERHVNGCCLLLAYFEQFFRAWFRPDSSPLYRALVACAEPEEVWHQVCTPVLLQDLRMLSRLFCRRWDHAFGKPVALNPTFAGSRLVGGADADIIVEGTLVEFKTSRQPRPLGREHLWQLLGYVLLDFEDTHRIDAAGFDFARHDMTRSWTVEELTSILAESRRPIADWRRQMQRVCMNLKSHLRARAEDSFPKIFERLLPEPVPTKRRSSRRASRGP